MNEYDMIPHCKDWRHKNPTWSFLPHMGRKSYVRKSRLQFMLFHYLIVFKIQQPQGNKLDSFLLCWSTVAPPAQHFSILMQLFLLNPKQNYLEEQQKTCREACDRVRIRRQEMGDSLWLLKKSMKSKLQAGVGRIFGRSMN